MKDSHSFDPGSNPGTSTSIDKDNLVVVFVKGYLSPVLTINYEQNICLVFCLDGDDRFPRWMHRSR